MKKLRVGFIGSGGMADAHLKGLSDAERFPDVQIAAFCDVVLERAQSQCEKYAAHEPQAFNSPSQMLAEAGLDACYVLLPPFAHGDAERACIEHNVPFLVEKPIGNDLGVLRELRDEVQRKNLITAVGYMNRYQPSVERARQTFSNDQPIIAYGGWLGGPPLTTAPNFGKSLIGQWWVIKEKSGGQFVEQVTHTVDLVRYFLGDAVEVFAHGTTEFNKKLAAIAPNYSIEDAMVVSIKFAGGAIANIMSSCATPVGGSVSLHILGGQTSAQFSGWAHDVKLAYKDSDGTTHEEAVSGVSDIFPIEDRAFLDAVHSGDHNKIRSNYADGFKTSQITLGANQSLLTGQPVPID
ncbi:MAG TPA: Gfo/Idh/MocA family oxidoreductase [Abditibacteriaceae bacterium]|jgi:predicted dehydrogenase